MQVKVPLKCEHFYKRKDLILRSISRVVFKVSRNKLIQMDTLNEEAHFYLHYINSLHLLFAKSKIRNRMLYG